jgi:hypothetical protein
MTSLKMKFLHLWSSKVASIGTLFFSPFIVVLGGDTLWHLQRFLQCIKYSYWMHPLHLCPSSPLPYSWNSFNRYHFCIYIHVYTLFALYSSSYPLSLLCWKLHSYTVNTSTTFKFLVSFPCPSHPLQLTPVQPPLSVTCTPYRKNF